MAARINNAPAHIVFDRSTNASVSVTTSGLASNLTTGNILLSRDGDITTTYTNTYQQLASPGNSGMITTFTYPTNYLNCQLSGSLSFTSTNVSGLTYYLEYSEDLSSWTLINSDAVGVGTITYKFSNTYFTVKGVRIRIEASGNPQTITQRIYELRLMGSG